MALAPVVATTEPTGVLSGLNGEAADALGLPVPTVADLADGMSWPAPAVAVGVVETAGGVRSPQADDGDVLDVVRALAPDHIVVVADAGLGTVNAVRLSVAALTDGGGSGPPPPTPVVVLNRFDASSELHRRNLAWLRDRDHLCVMEGSAENLASLATRLASP